MIANFMLIMRVAVATLAVLSLSSGVSLASDDAGAEVVSGEETVGQAFGPQPPAGSPALLRNIELRFPTQGNVSGVDYLTYLYYMEIKNHVSLPSQGKWVPYNEATERIVRDDFRRLWDTGFLNDLWVEAVDEPWENGVEGKRIIFNLEERERVKIVTFEGSKKLTRGDIDTKLQEDGIVVRLDSFIDPRTIRRVKGVVREMFAEKGYQFAEVDHTISEMPGGPKLVRLAFHMGEGPKVQLQQVEFIGNTAISDRVLKGKMKNMRERWWLSWLTGRGTYKEPLFEEDAERIVSYYRDRGYIEAQVGAAELDYLEESADGKTRGLHLRIPVDEGQRYRIAGVNFAGNEVLKEAALREIFKKLKPGDYYSEGAVRKGFETAREVYGAIGYYEMTLYPDLQPRMEAEAGQGEGGNGHGSGNDGSGRPTHIEGAPVVDLTIRVQEGEQYFIDRITFTGNKTTHDEVIRRELQLVENGVFNTEGLKYSVRRLNQLGYFEQFDEDAIRIEKSEADSNEVDITFDLTEANLNQLTFGAGVSQYDGFFGQVSFQTTNFRGRGETFSVALQSGSRARNYQVSFTEPFLLGRPLSLGTNLFSRRIKWIGSFTEDTKGGSFTFGWPLTIFTRMFLRYSFESTEVSDINPYLASNVELVSFNPFLQDTLLLGMGGRRTISRITPTLVSNTIDHPIFPNSGRSLSAAIELAGTGGNTKFWKPILDGIWYIPHTSRTIIGLRMQYQHLNASDPNTIPVFERLWLGGEYSVRGFDIRRIGPTLHDINPEVPERSNQGRTLVGGNKSLLFNAEYQFVIGGPVRLVMFYDAGQVQDFGREFAMNDFKTSTGLELRFFLPMLNVPFRFIYAWNMQRDGMYNDKLREQEETVFRFAVGTMF